MSEEYHAGKGSPQVSLFQQTVVVCVERLKHALNGFGELIIQNESVLCYDLHEFLTHFVRRYRFEMTP